MSDGIVADRRLHPAALAIRFIRKVPEFVVGIPAVVGWSSNAGFGLILGLIAAGAAIAFGAAFLSWRAFRYGVGGRDIVIESGVLQRQRRIIPFDRIHDVEIEQGLLARLFGTVTVRIETGGGAKDEGKLDAVALGEAHRLRDIVRARGADEPVPQIEEEPLLFEMTLPRLLLAGLFNFSLLYLALIGGAFEYLRPLFALEDIDPRELLGAGQAAGTAAILAGSLVLIAALLTLGVITGVARTVAKDYRFRLWRSRTGLRRKRGLFTLSEAVIPLGRIQLALLRSGAISRLFGWSALEYQTLGAGQKQSGHQQAAPFASMSEIVPILEATGHAGLPPPDDYVRVSRLSVAHRSVRLLAPMALVILALSILNPATLLLFILFPFLIGAAVLRWKRHRYALTGEALFVAQGLFERRLWIVPFGKAQTVTLTRSPLQRRLGLASVTVDTAGASLLAYPAIVDLDAPAAEALGARLLDLYKESRRAQRMISVQERLHHGAPAEQEGVRGQA